MSLAQEILKQYWGFSAFRELQEEIVNSVLEGNDTLALLPTGGGKSICFQAPALAREGVCLVISPLIALMKDQVANLKKRGVSAEAIYSGMHYNDIDRILDNCVHGQIKFLYLSPERLGTDLAIERIKRMQVNLIAIDEAHCISQWGYDFRPSYLNISKIREILPKVPMMALTATATKEVVEDIQEKLEFNSTKRVFKKSFARPNLAYLVFHEEDKKSKMLDILKKVDGSAVVYVLNRKETKEIALFLYQNNISAGYYHAGLEADKRAEIQDAWIRNDIRVIVATNAFGMGIDKPDVRVVIHLTLPDSLEAYFQEAGRAGRDGEKAFGILLFNQTDRDRIQKNFDISFPSFSEIRQVYRALGSYFQLAIGAGENQDFKFDLIDFSKRFDLDPIKVSSALKILVQSGYIELSDAYYAPSTVQILADKKTLYDYMLRQPKSELLIKFLLRSYQGINNHKVNIREQQIAHGLKWSILDVEKLLANLDKDEIIKYTAQTSHPFLTFLTDRQDADNLLFDKARYDFLKNRAEFRINASLDYAEKIQCRSINLLNYFDDKEAKKCGQCDFCLGRYESPTKEERKKITDYLKKILSKDKLTVKAILNRFPTVMDRKVIEVLEFLIENDYLERDEFQSLFWKE